jgi:uncharacterized membrane protein (UPF0127 family)
MHHHGPTWRGTLIALGVVVVCALVAVTFFFFYMRSNSVDPATAISDFPGYRASTVEIDGTDIRVAIADTPALQELGLGNRNDLPDGEGMLFIFTTDSEEAFWMKDMNFSIDMVWISVEGNIVYMAQNVSPDTYPENFVPTSPARYVLELPAGYAQAHGFKVGDTVRL